MLSDLIKTYMPNLTNRHKFVVYPLDNDEVTLYNGHCLLLLFRDRDGIDVSSIFLDGDRMLAYQLGRYLVVKRNAIAVVGSSKKICSNPQEKVLKELEWYDCVLSMCAVDILTGELNWLLDYPYIPNALASPTVVKIEKICQIKGVKIKKI